MNSQELRALQEAYMEVYMDEGWKPLPTEKMKERQQRYQSRYSSPFGSGHLLSQPMDKRISDYKKSVKIGDVLSKSTTTRNPKKLKKLEDDIDKLSTKEQQLAEQLGLSDYYEPGSEAKLKELQAQYATVKQALLDAEALWLESQD